MPERVEPGTGLLFMKVGTHANESLVDIIRRKRKEIDDAGHAFWGYGGNTCHPTGMVQPFVRAYEKRGSAIYLCMEPMNSNHFADPIRAEEFSIDGFEWQVIPAAINAKGSRYALVIDQIEEQEFALPLSRTEVAWGNSKGMNGDKYIRGRVDKGCLEVIAPSPEGQDGRIATIGLVARIVKPYAVFLRNHPV
jgi:hypothetical protein